MKILMLSSRYEPYTRGGAERAARTLATHARQLGHEVVVLTTTGSHEVGDRIVDDIRVRGVPLRNVYDFGDASSLPSLKPVWHFIDAFNPAMQAAVSRVIAEERPDVIHTHLLTGFSASAWTAARASGIPVVHTLHDHYVLCARSTMAIDGEPCVGRHLECVVLTQPRMFASHGIAWVVGVSKYILDRHIEYRAFEGVRHSVIPNPCHLVGASSDGRRSSDGLRLGFMGRIERQKGIELLVEAMASLPPHCTLVVAGTGEPSYVDRIHAMSAGRQITFVGTVDPAAFLRDIDVQVVPSLVPESFGLSAAEAHAMGIPVVASNRGALPELITAGRNGWIFDPTESGALAAVLKRVADGRDRLAGMRADCRESVRHLDPAAIAVQYGEVYETIVSQRAARR